MPMAWKGQLEQIVTFADLQIVKRAMEEMKLAYLHMIKDRDVVTKFANEPLSTSREMKEKVDEHTFELKSTKNSLENTQIILLEAEEQLASVTKFKEQENEERVKESR